MGENIDAAERIEGVSECPRYGVAIADVGLQGQGPPTVRRDFGCDLIGALAARLVDDCDVGAASRKFERDGSTHASATPGNERGAT